ncbi:hypothetical protein AWZ03_002152 [Drosophila navojoa]|uniref:Uncharacterized protein n=1 Tax=Drosophila navojoa TaxID=7232 RepID=A0A484BRD9_DRONA|nr:uncharacterized protein LOC115565761 [Drosophila navojoa]TDG51357.1 hypothetical protein AWZ03_002152 [Drosophila navojoa]
MFKVNLKALLQLSLSTKGPLLRHKRIKCGKGSYLLCYVLQDGYLKISQAKGLRRGRCSKGLQRQSSKRTSTKRVCDANSQTTIGSLEEPTTRDTYSQTTVVQHSHCSVDTLDLSLMVSRQQQTTIRIFNFASCQTKKLKMEMRSTQVELSLKSRWTQTRVMPVPRSIAGTQTTFAASRQASYVQTDISSLSAVEEQEQEELKERIVNLLLRSMNSQSILLLKSVESLNQLLELKQLELQKQKLEKKQEAAKQVELAKLKQRQPKRASKRLHCPKFRIWAKPISKPNKLVQKEVHIQTDQLSIISNGTQTELLREMPLVRLAEAATQTDRVKGLSWLRLSS